MNSDFKIRITKEQYKLLNKIFKQNKNIFFIKGNYLTTNKKNIDFIVNNINGYFIQHGLLNNYEPSSLGNQLEDFLELLLNNTITN